MASATSQALQGRLIGPATLTGVLVVGALAVTSLAGLGVVERAEQRSRRANQDVLAIASVRTAFEHRVAAFRGFLLSGAPEFQQRADTARREFLKLVRELETSGDDPLARRMAARIRQAEQRHNQALGPAITARQAGKRPFAIDLEKVILPRQLQVLASIQSLSALRKATAEQEMSRAAAGLNQMRWVLGAVAAIALLAVVGIALVQLRAARRAQQELARWTRFLSIASHELKSPLTTLSLQVQTLALLLEQGGPGAQTAPELVKKMSRQVSGMATLVTNVLDASRMQATSTRLELDDVDLAELVRDSVARLQPMFDEEAVPVMVRTPAPVCGRWDPLRLEQVVTNLLSNALKFGQQKPVEVAVEDHGGQARLSVRDQGAGIPGEEQAAIFEQFTRASGVRRAGHGLGLWITRAIVAAHGGAIAVESQPGAGATFIVDLPKQQLGT